MRLLPARRTVARLAAGSVLLLLLAAPAPAVPATQELKETVIGVSGMFCSSCASAIEQALKKVDGVVEARVDPATDRVRVRYDGKMVTPRGMAEAIRRAGYRAHLPAEPAR